MNAATKLIVLAFAIALATGCSKNKVDKRMSGDLRKSNATAEATTRPSGDATASSATTQPTGGVANAISSPLVAPDQLAGAWHLAVPRRGVRDALISFTDASHLTIRTDEKLFSGDYVVQGPYLLILTNDEQLRPLAWRINSPDSLTVVRPPDPAAIGTDYTGVTLIRAAPASAEGEDASQGEEASVRFEDLSGQ